MKLLRFPSLGSTMDEARRAVTGGESFPFIILAEHQTAGRGRIEGRDWISSPGASLTMTLCLDPAMARLPALPLRIGLGIAAYLENLPGPASRIALKWPNDILGWSGKDHVWKKLGGLLCESSNSGLFAGIGINLKTAAYTQALQAKAIALEEVLKAQDREREAVPELEILAQGLATSIIANIDNPNWREAYQNTMWGLDMATEFIQGDPRSGKKRYGTILGVDEEGLLLLREAGSAVLRYASGEITCFGLRD